jgi:hypothetical protein
MDYTFSYTKLYCYKMKNFSIIKEIISIINLQHYNFREF